MAFLTSWQKPLAIAISISTHPHFPVVQQQRRRTKHLQHWYAVTSVAQQSKGVQCSLSGAERQRGIRRTLLGFTHSGAFFAQADTRTAPTAVCTTWTEGRGSSINVITS